MENTLTANGDTEILFAKYASLTFSGSIDGGTFTLKRLKHGTDASVDSNWIAVQDKDGVATYTTSPGGNYFQFGEGVRLRATLSGATSPALEYQLLGTG